MQRVLSGSVVTGACMTLLAVALIAFVVEVSLATPLSLVIGALVATAVVTAARPADLDRMAAALRAAHVFLPILAYLVTVAWIGSTRAAVRFDGSGAQVIAVLVLALAIDVRFFRLTQLDDAWSAFLRPGVLGAVHRHRCVTVPVSRTISDKAWISAFARPSR